MFTGKGKQLTIYIGETDQHEHQALHMALIELLRREGCSGATATRGIAGFGASSLVHTSAILRLSMDMPITITVVDRPARIDRVLGAVREMAPNALITAQEVDVLQSGSAFKEGLPDVNVSEVMRHEVAAVAPDTPITQVVELLLGKNFTAIPVIDAQRKVVGMVSDNDLLTRGGMKLTLNRSMAAADPDFVRKLHESLDDPQRKVSDVMTTDVVTVSPDTVLGSAAKLMVQKHLKRLPVVDQAGTLVGILGRLDILNTIAAVHLPEWNPDTPSAGPHATVGDVMTREVPTLHESATIEQIFDLLVGSSHKRVVVIDDERRVAGIIADSDLISKLSREGSPGLLEILVARIPMGKAGAEARKDIRKVRARSARELMTREVITVRQEMPVVSALVLSAEKTVKRMPVVDADGKLVGIVGRTEMMRALLS